MTTNILKDKDLESLINQADMLVIDAATLGKVAFEDVYDNVLTPMLKTFKKRIQLPKDFLRKLRDNQRIDDKYLKIQKYIIEGDYNTFSDTLKNCKKKALVFVGDKRSGNIVLRYKRHKAIFFSKDGFSYFTKSTQVSQTARKTSRGLNTAKAKIKGEIPKAGDRVSYTDKNTKKQAILTKQMNGKGEGNIYITDSKLLAKIYKQNEQNKNELKVPVYVFDKLKKFEKIKLDSKYSPYVCLPKFRVFNSKNECVGFLMEKANGKEFNHILGSSSVRNKAYPNIKYKNLVKMCINFLNLSIKLHEKNIIIGDIKLDNLMFDTNDNVYIIDCDSFQIDGYPCPVGTKEFLHPSNRGKSMKEVVRSLADEYYAIAVFLFMVLHLGQHPYNRKGSMTGYEAQGKQIFPYAKSNIKDAPPATLNHWNRLDSTLQDYFINTFNKNGKYTPPEKILSPQKWLKAIESFYNNLK